MGTALLTFFTVMILIGSLFGHQAVGDPISAIALGLPLGIFTFAATNYGFALVRPMYLSDALLARGPAWVQRWPLAPLAHLRSGPAHREQKGWQVCDVVIDSQPLASCP